MIPPPVTAFGRASDLTLPSPSAGFSFYPRHWPGAPSCQCSELLSFTVSVARTLRERREACDTRGLSPGPLVRVLEKPPQKEQT
jgi:hypothetical protein